MEKLIPYQSQVSNKKVSLSLSALLNKCLHPPRFGISPFKGRD
ncbi:MAG: hypothetical protein ACTSXH_13785 [Promethearchaeota archaeon]